MIRSLVHLALTLAFACALAVLHVSRRPAAALMIGAALVSSLAPAAEP